MGNSQLALVLINGAVPGLGKSTLAHELARRLRNSGSDVELFEEREILERTEFAYVIDEWISSANVSAGTLLAATNRYLNWCTQRAAAVYILDSLLPFLPSLLAWGWSDSDIADFFVELASGMSHYQVLHVQLEGHARISLQRAAKREGKEWLEWFIKKVGGYADEGGRTKDLDSVIAYLDSAMARSHRVLCDAPWQVCFIDADGDADAVADEVMCELEPVL